MEQTEIEDLIILKKNIKEIYEFLKTCDIKSFDFENDLEQLNKFQNYSINTRLDYLRISNTYFTIKEKYTKFNNFNNKLKNKFIK